MDATSLIATGIAIVVIFFFIKLIAVPFVRIILGVIAFIILLDLLQRFAGFNLNQILAPFGINVDLSKWGINLNWLLNPINYYINQAISFFHQAWDNVPKNK